MSVESEFDLGSLTWVKGELDIALEAARTALAEWNGEDSNPLKAAAAYLHQVYGALQIVDLQGVSQVANETERLVAEMALRADLRNAESAEIALHAIAALKAYLDDLMAGAAHVELKLAATLRAVVTRRGGEPPSPSELFYPDTGVRVPRESLETPLDNESRNRTLRSARLRYQKGLLQFLQNKDAQQGLAQMSAAIDAVEKVAPGTAQYSFWWTAAALIEVLQRQGVATDFLLKRLCGRIDMQMRRLVDGSKQLADRLVRDVLFYVAQDTAPSGRSALVNELFGLAHYFPAAPAAEDGLSRVQLALLRDHLTAALDYWIHYCAGRRENRLLFQKTMRAVQQAASALPNVDMQTLLASVQTIAESLPGAADALQNEALQLEMATAVLLAQNATEHYAALNDEFHLMANTQVMRLHAAIDPQFDAGTIPDLALLEEISAQAQQKLLLVQLTQEIQTNLNRVEEILDRFFRDAKDRAELPMAPNLLKQVLGAFNSLQRDVAAALVSVAIQRIEHFSVADAQIAPENLNWVAEALSTLGLYLDALRQGRDDKQGLMNLLAQPEVRVRPDISVEAQIKLDIERLKDAARRWSSKGRVDDPGGDIAARATLQSELSQLTRDADLIGDATLRAQADTAMKALAASQGVSGAPHEVMVAVKNIGVTAVVVATPAPSAEAVRLAAASDEDVDQEMLSVFIEEAHEVLADIFDQVARLNLSSLDHAAFSAIRRGFHTLKGSGRMVGLMDLAEPAWEIEQTLNVWLRDEKSPDADMLDFLQMAGDTFQGWVSTLEKQGRALIEASTLIRTARQLRGETSPMMTEEPPPPKTEADILAQPMQDVGLNEVEARDEDEVFIGDHVLPAELFAIYRDEALMRLAELTAALAELAQGQQGAAWMTLIRAAHTLAGISRTTGFLPLADAAHQLELWAHHFILRWPDKNLPLSREGVAGVQTVLDLLQQSVEGILAFQFPVALPQVAKILALAVTHDEVDAQLLPIFMEEAEALLPRIGSLLRQWRGALDDPTARDALKRTLHSLKGSARMVGAMRLGEAVHELETEVIERGEQAATLTYLDSLESAYDHFTDLVEQLKNDSHAAAPATVQAPIHPEEEMRTRQTLRLKSDIMDTLLNEAGEVAIARSRIENVLSSYKVTVQELASNVDRLRGQLRELEIQAESQMHSRLSQVEASQFDPLEFDRFTRLQELTRLMAESVNDVSTAQDNLLSGINETDNALLLQSRMMRNLQQELMHIRMVPLNTLAERLHRVVRQTAKETGRKAQLELEGGQTEMDRAILDKIAAPLEHLLRNAVAHGIETPEVRAAAGKTDYGELRLSARQEGNEITLTLVDDGAGIDFAAVHVRAEQHGWLRPGEAAGLDQLEAFLFRSGFSTAKTITEIAGRGVGLDVVKSEITQLGGRVKLESEAGKGVRFTLRLPLTLALTQVVLARAGGQTWGLPAALVTLVQEVKVEHMQALHDIGYLELNGERFPLRTLADLVGRNAQAVEGRTRTVLLLRAGERHLAIRVDALECNHEAVVKNIGPQLAHISGISGATVLGDGRVALIIDPFLLAEHTSKTQVEPTAEAIDLAPLIMVVDDSLTVRKITTRFLQREGYRVVTARDGVEALEMLTGEKLAGDMPALMLLDIEMPRMDGFEVVRHVRASDATRTLPIIMITSRTADKHRSHALETGVNGYMGKPYQEEELLSEIQRLT